jgi:hypothetical protein
MCGFGKGGRAVVCLRISNNVEYSRIIHGPLFEVRAYNFQPYTIVRSAQTRLSVLLTPFSNRQRICFQISLGFCGGFLGDTVRIERPAIR